MEKKVLGLSFAVFLVLGGLNGSVNAESSGEVLSVSSDFGDEKSNLLDQIEKLNNLIGVTNKNYTELQHDSEIKIDLLKSLESELSKLKREYHKESKNRVYLNSRIASLKSDIGRLDRSIKSKEKEITVYKKNKKVDKKKLSKMLYKVNVDKKTLVKNKGIYKKLMSDDIVLQKRIDTLKRDLYKVTKDISSINKLMEKNKVTLKELNMELEKYNRLLKLLENELINIEEKPVFDEVDSEESEDPKYTKLELTDSEYRLEAFIKNYLVTEDHMIRTDLLERSGERLSESQTLWMEHLLLTGDEVAFRDAVDALERNFIHPEGHVGWVITDGSLSTVNAWIDDARAIRVLNEGFKKFGDVRYEELAIRISKSLVDHNLVDGYFADMYDSKYNYANKEITVLYSDMYVIDFMIEKGMISEDVRVNMVNVVKNVESMNGLYAFKFDIDTKSYRYDESSSVLDQAYVAIAKLEMGEDTSEFADTIKSLHSRDGKLYGRYNPSTLSPTVEFESVAGYALLSVYFDRIGDEEFSEVLMNRMKDFRAGENSVYYGGHIYDESKQTHSYDSLMSLYAEITNRLD